MTTWATNASHRKSTILTTKEPIVFADAALNRQSCRTSPRCLPRKIITPPSTLTVSIICKSFQSEASLRRLKEKTAPSNAQTSMHRNTQKRKNMTLPRKTILFSNWTPKEWRPMSYLKKNSKLLCWGSPVKFKRTQTTQWTQTNNAWTK